MPHSFRSAVHLFIFQEDNILLSLRCNTGYRDGCYSVVAGHLEGDELVVEAAIREAREEAGIEIRPEDVEVVGVMHRLDGEERIDFFVRIQAWAGEITNAEPHKCDELAWYPLDQLPENMIPYVRRAIQNYFDKTWFDSFGWEEK